MKKQFVTYEIAKKLKELGFDEECIAIFQENKELMPLKQNHSFLFNLAFNHDIKVPTAPLWQQAIDWLREEHDIKVCECPSGGWKVWEKSDKKWLSFTFEFELSKAIEEAIKLIPNS